MKLENPYQIAQAGLVAQHQLLDMENGDPDALQRFIKDPQSKERKAFVAIFAAMVESGLKPKDYMPTIEDCLMAWPNFCKEFGLAVEVDFEALKFDSRITSRMAGFDWIVYCPKGLTARQALDLCREQFKVWDDSVNPDDYCYERGPDKTDLVLCRATIEPDQEWLGQTADGMRDARTGDKEIAFLDHRERYVLEAFYFWLTKRLAGKGKHLDLKGWTRCVRSRDSDGDVAGAYWSGGKFGAGWNDANDRYECAGGREAVPLKT